MPGQEKMVIEYYQKNPNAAQSLKGGIYEEKIIKLIKSKAKITSKKLTSKEAEKIITEFNKPKQVTSKVKDKKTSNITKPKTKKISKK